LKVNWNESKQRTEKNFKKMLQKQNIKTSE